MKFLLVDDNEHALHRLNMAVKEACPNDEIKTFTDPNEALNFAKTNAPDVAFLDIEMSGITGIVLGKGLKDINPAVRLVFCTGYSEYAMEALKLHVSGYLLKPVSAEDIKKEIEAMQIPAFIPSTKKIVIRTFGNFDVFIDGQVLDFSRNKSKEVLAILVDNDGSIVSSEQIADLLWEDGQFDTSRQKQLYTIISELRKTLQKYKADDILVKCNKGYAIDKSKVECDFYKLMDGDLSVLNSYDGRYMYEYSWAEFSIGKIEKLL